VVKAKNFYFGDIRSWGNDVCTRQNSRNCSKKCALKHLKPTLLGVKKISAAQSFKYSTCPSALWMMEAKKWWPAPSTPTSMTRRTRTCHNKKKAKKKGPMSAKWRENHKSKIIEKKWKEPSGTPSPVRTVCTRPDQLRTFPSSSTAGQWVIISLDTTPPPFVENKSLWPVRLKDL